MPETDDVKRLSCLEVWGGKAGLIDLLSKIDTKEPARMITEVTETLSRAGWEIRDDLTMLVFRPNGARRHIAWWEHFIIPFRLAKWVGRLALGR